MQLYVINALQLLGLGCISSLIGVLCVLLKLTNVKNLKGHAVFVTTILSFVGLAVLFQSRLFVARSLLDSLTWFSAMWFVYLLLFLLGFKLSNGRRDHHEFGESSMLSMQYGDETRHAATVLDNQTHSATSPQIQVASYVDSRGAVVQGTRPR